MWLASSSYQDGVYARLLTVITVLKATALALESVTKTRWITWDKTKHGPEDYIGIFGIATYFWLTPLFRTAGSKVITMADLPELHDTLKATSVMDSCNAKIDYSKLSGKYSLAIALARAAGMDLFLMFFWSLPTIAIGVLQPLLLFSVVTYLGELPNRSKNDGYGIIGAAIFIYLGAPFFDSVSTYYKAIFMSKVRSALINAIYRKSITLNASASDDSKAMTLMSSDMENIKFMLNMAENLWVPPIQCGLALWLMYRQTGVAFVSCVVLALITIVSGSLAARIIKPWQGKWMVQMEKRVGKTSTVITGLKGIKLAGLADAIERSILSLRHVEIGIANSFRRRVVTTYFVALFARQLSGPVTLAFSSNYSPAAMFATISYTDLVSLPLVIFFQFLPDMAIGLNAIKRIQDYLSTEERVDFREHCHNSNADSHAIEIISGSFGWAEDGEPVIRNLNAEIFPGITIVVGPVASGKSTLCRALLGETRTSEGILRLHRNAERIAYCDQSAFLVNSTIKENIVGFGSDIDEARYQMAVRAAMLGPDLEVLEKGDMSKVGSNGITLSGGQKQRVSIARAVYTLCDIYIFDDVLSGLDTDTEEAVFNNVFGPNGIMKSRNATVILCTHSVRHLSSANHIIALGTDGAVVEQGTFQDLVKNGNYVASLRVREKQQPLEAPEDDSTNTSHTNGEEPPPVKAHLDKDDDSDSDDDTYKDDITRKQGDWNVFFFYMKSIGPTIIICAIILGFIVSVSIAFKFILLNWWTADISSGNPTHSMAFWKGMYALNAIICMFGNTFYIYTAAVGLATVSGTNLHQRCLRRLLSATLDFITKTDAGVIVNLFSQDIFVLDEELAQNFINAQLSLFTWVSNAGVIIASSPYVAIAMPFLVLLAWVMQRIYLPTSRQLRLLDLESKNPLYTTYIDTVKGIVTYRAFQWTGDAVQRNDYNLDTSARPWFQRLLTQNWLRVWLSWASGVVSVLVVVLATQLGLGASTTGAALLAILTMNSNLQRTVSDYVGMETSIGAVNRLKAFSEKTPIEDGAGEDGKPPLTWPNKGRLEMKHISASYETAMGSKSASRHLVLQDISLNFDAGQKVAICGRTGSGKSSFILVLLRMLDAMSEGDEEVVMDIDGISLLSTDRASLRRRLIALPQDPVFLPDGSKVQENLDVEGNATEEECKAALEAVQLWSHVEAMGGLEGGLLADNLSHGQKQLFSLGRAIVRRRVRARLLAAEVGSDYLGSEKTAGEKKAAVVDSSEADRDGGILILDEYSSSLDIKTDRIMHGIIMQEFRHYTIIMVSHRLELAANSFDRAIVLDKGKIIEDGNPKQLAASEGTRFRELWLIGKHEDEEAEKKEAAEEELKKAAEVKKEDDGPAATNE